MSVPFHTPTVPTTRPIFGFIARSPRWNLSYMVIWSKLVRIP